MRLRHPDGWSHDSLTQSIQLFVQHARISHDTRTMRPATGIPVL